MVKDIAVYKGDNIRDKRLADATSADTVASGDSIVIKTVSGDYVEVDRDSFADEIRKVMGDLIKNNDKGTSVSGITVTDSNNDLGSVTPANLATALNSYITGSTPTLQAAAGANIGSVGTPSVTASTVGSTTTFTFDYLKGATGAQGPQGPTGPAFITSEYNFDICDNYIYVRRYNNILTDSAKGTLPSIGISTSLYTLVVIKSFADAWKGDGYQEFVISHYENGSLRGIQRNYRQKNYNGGWSTWYSM